MDMNKNTTILKMGKISPGKLSESYSFSSHQSGTLFQLTENNHFPQLYTSFIEFAVVNGKTFAGNLCKW